MFRKIFIAFSIEFGPILGFLIASEYMSFVKASTYFVGFSVIAIAVGIHEQKRLAIFPLTVAGSIILFGGATVLFDDPFYLIFKDTIYNALLAITLFIGIMRGTGWLKPLFKNLFALTDEGWLRYSVRWATFCLILAIGNEWARLHFSPHDWIGFKIFMTLATIAFAFAQVPLLKRFRLASASKWGFKV